MAVKPFSLIFNRFKMALRDDTCSLCHQPFQGGVSILFCSGCEKRLLMRTASPVIGGKAPLYSACEFPYRLKRALYSLKFNQQHQHGTLLSEILMHYWQKLPLKHSAPWVVLPIPPHGHRAHVPLFARAFASHQGYHFAEQALQWQHHVPAQHTLTSRRQRMHNLSDSFQVDSAWASNLPKQASLLVVDDLLTTGATLQEAVSALQKALPQHTIVGLTVCHVPFTSTRQPTLQTGVRPA